MSRRGILYNINESGTARLIFRKEQGSLLVSSPSLLLPIYPFTYTKFLVSVCYPKLQGMDFVPDGQFVIVINHGVK
ncbi:hypothetical protein Y032_0413g1011 [Ancylostoma ceylanicum]|uniref:Uncharacterized protein n=1 Tax=Ancylostoma ceylanicum TaxID=53326 RepID=A0A016X234_9BILA|nr:hypothetical protein Y032_0413g1011 [Ancylostoma ceylanicum]